MAAAQKLERPLDICAKRTNLEELAPDPAQLKENDTKSPARPTLRKRREFLYDESKKLDGIISYLTRKCGGNVYDKGIVNVVQTYDSSGRNVVAFENTKSFSFLGVNSWLCYDFRDRRVIPTSYSVRSSDSYHHLRSWAIEVSNDGRSWTEIDRRHNNNDLEDEFVTCNFGISSVPREGFRFFRLRLTMNSRKEPDLIDITALEVFGTLLVMEKIEQPLKQEFVCRADREEQTPPPLFTPKLDGIIAYLTCEYGGNVCDKGIVNVMGTCEYQDRLVDLSALCGCTSECKDSWICYDFIDRGVIPKSYSVRSSDSDNHLKSWVIEVSNDGYSWTEIDRRENNNELNDKFALSNFKISHVPRKSFRFFRLRQTGENHKGTYAFSVSSLEIFGTLFVVEKIEQPQLMKQDFVYQPDREGQVPPPLFAPKLDGIIAHLTRECCGNVHQKGIVYVMGMGLVQENPVDLMTYSEYKTPWICYDFIDRRVIPRSYSVRSHERNHLKSWVIEVSNDGYSWTEIERRENNNDLNDRFALSNFKISHIPRKSFRFFRLRQTAESHFGWYSFTISALEIFGTLHVAEKIEHPRLPERVFVYRADREEQVPPPLISPKLDGIIAHLTRDYGGNVHDKGIVNITVKDVEFGHPKWVAELETESFYRSGIGENQWICYDFKERRVIPTSYSLMNYGKSAGGKHLRSWVIEVSNDWTGNTWTEIDRQDDSHMYNSHQIENYKISSVPRKSYRFFRLRQTGLNMCGEHGFVLSSLEIFGTLYEK